MPYTHLPDRCALCGKGTRRWRTAYRNGWPHAHLPICHHCGIDLDGPIAAYCDAPIYGKRAGRPYSRDTGRYTDTNTPPGPEDRQRRLF